MYYGVPFHDPSLPLSVMPGLSRSKNGVASLAYVPGIHVLFLALGKQVVDGRDEPGHDEVGG
jgi:hypothetical protein